MSNVHPSAGVYTTETDLSQRVRASSTSIGVAVGASLKGPVGERTLVTDTAELKSIFGKHDPKNHGFMTLCADPFIQQSNLLYVTRVVNNALTAGAYVTADDPLAAAPLLTITNFDDGANVPKGVVDPIKNIGFNPGDVDIDSNLFFIAAHNPGEWNNKISVRIRPSNPAGRAIGEDHNPLHFNIDVYYDYTGPNNLPVETYLVSRSLGEVDGNGQSMFLEDAINGRSAYIKVKNNPFAAQIPMVASPFEFLNGGTNGIPVTNDQIAEAWALYEDAEAIDVNILLNCGYTSPIVQRVMVDIAEKREDATAILDMPFAASEVVDAINYRRNDLNIISSYGAIYGPWLQVRDTDNNKKLFVPPSGFVGAAYALTDSNASVWFAPAGIARGSLKVLTATKKYNQGARDALDRAQVNAIRFLPGRGWVVWGQSTLQTVASATENVSVRRLFNFMKKSIATAIAVGVFEPQDSFLRSKLTNIAEGFLDPIKQGRGLYGYEVICNEKNNTPDVIAAGDLKLDVYADPTIAAKRIHLTAHINPTGQANFIEG